MLCEKVKWKNENRLERFARLCIRIGINDLYALKNNIIDEEELQFMHEVMEELEARKNNDRRDF